MFGGVFEHSVVANEDIRSGSMCQHPDQALATQEKAA
jgi:hypothetical protein